MLELQCLVGSTALRNDMYSLSKSVYRHGLDLRLSSLAASPRLDSHSQSVHRTVLDRAARDVGIRLGGTSLSPGRFFECKQYKNLPVSYFTLQQPGPQN